MIAISAIGREVIEQVIECLGRWGNVKQCAKMLLGWQSRPLVVEGGYGFRPLRRVSSTIAMMATVTRMGIESMGMGLLCMYEPYCGFSILPSQVTG